MERVELTEPSSRGLPITLQLLRCRRSSGPHPTRTAQPCQGQRHNHQRPTRPSAAFRPIRHNPSGRTLVSDDLLARLSRSACQRRQDPRASLEPIITPTFIMSRPDPNPSTTPTAAPQPSQPTQSLHKANRGPSPRSAYTLRLPKHRASPLTSAACSASLPPPGYNRIRRPNPTLNHFRPAPPTRQRSRKVRNR